jgi:hypothetical protein
MSAILHNDLVRSIQDQQGARDRAFRATYKQTVRNQRRDIPRKVKHMRVQGVSLELKPKNPCPVCGVETALAEIEPHPLHVNFEIHGYLCEHCGPIKSLVVPSARRRKKH